MNRIAYVFPGQGAQYVGMGKDFYDTFEEAREVFELASKVTGINIEKICFEENENINRTEYTQIAILTTELAILQVMNRLNLEPYVCAGLSLGEYAALAAANAMDYRDVFSLVRKRGIYMQNAYPQGGGMSAVIGLDADIVREICSMASGYCDVANYNCPGQVVITGEEKAVLEASELLMNCGARKCIPLKVSGPFHSKLLEEVGTLLEHEMTDIIVRDPSIPYISNVTADYVLRREQIKELLCKQVSYSVKWQQSIERMIDDGVDTFVEIGPGKTLSGFIRKINRDVKIYNVSAVGGLKILQEDIVNGKELKDGDIGRVSG